MLTSKATPTLPKMTMTGNKTGHSIECFRGTKLVVIIHIEAS